MYGHATTWMFINLNIFVQQEQKTNWVWVYRKTKDKICASLGSTVDCVYSLHPHVVRSLPLCLHSHRHRHGNYESHIWSLFFTDSGVTGFSHIDTQTSVRRRFCNKTSPLTHAHRGGRSPVLVLTTWHWHTADCHWLTVEHIAEREASFFFFSWDCQIIHWQKGFLLTNGQMKMADVLKIEL